MPQRVLILDLRSYTPKPENGQQKPTQFYMNYAAKGDGQGLQPVESRVGVDVFNKLASSFPCVADVEFGMGGSFRGEARLAIVDAKPITKFQLPTT